jgi:hypothetical protein
MFHGMLLVLLGIREYDIRCAFRAVAAGERRHSAIGGPSTGAIRVADRYTIVKRHEEGVGIPVKRQMRSAMYEACIVRL